MLDLLISIQFETLFVLVDSKNDDREDKTLGLIFRFYSFH